jgi:(p)ppGpp synthase/HD superfamily hydrolase
LNNAGQQKRSDLERYAQTNLQLYTQLRKSGYGEEAITGIRRAYGLAARLFAGRYRASEKPFVDHLVGTASVLVSIQARPALILAALLHAAYVQGDFGDGPPGMTPAHAASLRRILGEEAERLVAEYTRFPWSAADFAHGADRGNALIAREKDLVLLRLANELDDLADCGILYYADGERRRAEALKAAPVWIAWAKQLSPELATALAGALEDLRSARVPAALQTESTQSFDSRKPPSSALWKRALRRFRSV